MKKLVPEIFIPYCIYDEANFYSISAVIELARMNATMTLYEYVPILNTSLEDGEKAPDHSVKKDKDSWLT